MMTKRAVITAISLFCLLEILAYVAIKASQRRDITRYLPTINSKDGISVTEMKAQVFGHVASRIFFVLDRQGKVIREGRSFLEESVGSGRLRTGVTITGWMSLQLMAPKDLGVGRKTCYERFDARRSVRIYGSHSNST